MDMLDEVSEVTVQPDGKVETKKLISAVQTIREMQAKELEESIAESSGLGSSTSNCAPQRTQNRRRSGGPLAARMGRESDFRTRRGIDGGYQAGI
jgi:hypothetical protein